MRNAVLTRDLAQIHSGIADDGFDGAEILITGCAGFLGFYFLQYLTRYSRELGLRRVVGLDNFMLDKPKWLVALAKEFPDILDLREFDIVRHGIESVEGAEGISHVIHMASIASPVYYRRYPIQTLDANVWGLRRLLDYYSSSAKLRGFLFFSSSEIYGDPAPDAIPTDEEYRGNVSCVGPRACYDEAKRFGETMCQLFSREYGLPITVARPFNNYGPGMRLSDKRLPADFAKCAMERRDIVVLSNGKPTRTFCYVADAVTGYLKCLLHGKHDYFNIGIEKPEISVIDVARIYQAAAAEILDADIGIEFERSEDSDYLSDNPNRRCPNIDKARRILGYEPTTLVDEGIRRYLSFLKAEQQTS